MHNKNFYLDTSALLPYYRKEASSEAIQDFLLSLSRPVYISDLTEVEFSSAISRWVRMKEITEAHAGLVEDAFEEDKRAGLFNKVPLARRHYQQAIRWIRSRKTALRTLDALHLACSFLADVEMVTSDEILAKSAAVLGISCCLIGA